MDINSTDVTSEQLHAAAQWEVEFAALRAPPPPARWAQFQAWLNADPRHTVAFQRVNKMAERLENLGARFWEAALKGAN